MSLRKKPWNRVNLPVYSVSSTDGKGFHNMHIITYASQVSMQPKQFICGIYYGTKTLELVQTHKRFVLQLLSKEQYKLVNILGRKSGNDYNKIIYLEKKNLLQPWNGFYILKHALAVIELQAHDLLLPDTTMPDHHLFLCSVIAYKNLNDGQPLTLDELRKHKIIRI
ncbi:flavin reductase family protein [Panacibacter ginsenosidivorans]|uniref:Flavin reductase family protein n=1 Tax=Panacibacter ginsenosidivorans TaxID=1813871 RepID=A0A5B8V9K8_9BACT|nr:flavin reductase family protein [Panacibacter ginsenosidivorans]QEC68012.1 flavin reductase family protein [Panacibacter ginsenosidivorans]